MTQVGKGGKLRVEDSHLPFQIRVSAHSGFGKRNLCQPPVIPLMFGDSPADLFDPHPREGAALFEFERLYPVGLGGSAKCLSGRGKTYTGGG